MCLTFIKPGLNLASFCNLFLSSNLNKLMTIFFAYPALVFEYRIVCKYKKNIEDFNISKHKKLMKEIILVKKVLSQKKLQSLNPT